MKPLLTSLVCFTLLMPKNAFECLYTIRNSNFWVANTHLHCHEEAPTTCRRRSVLQRAAHILLPVSFVSEGRCTEMEEPAECRDGAIISESAVPGAYQQVCMTLPQRSTTLKSTDQVVSVLQGSVGAGQTGVAVWNSCLLLARLLDTLTKQSPSWLQGKTVVELGCGTALASISCAKLGASRVFATDGNANVVELANKNIIQNQVEDRAEAVTLQWGFLNAMDFVDTADVVIGSDLTYNSGSWRVLAETITTILKPGGIMVYLTLGHAGFNVDGELNGFLSVVQSEGLQVVKDPPAPFKNLSQTLLRCISPQEKTVLDTTGGVRVLLLQKPQVKKLA